MQKPSVSIIIATYNRADYIHETIQSVLNQTFKDFELIIIDDASEDNTREIVYSFDDSRIKYYYQNKSGQNISKNAGFKKAQGNYIAIIDSDDVWHAEKLEKQVNILKNQKNIGLVYSGTNLIDKKSKPIGKKPLLSYSGNVLKELLLTNFLYNGSNALYRRECIEKAGMFDELIPTMIDWDLYLRLALYFDFHCIEEYLLDYRVHDDNMSCNFKKYELSGLRILDKICNHKRFPDNLRSLKKKAYALRHRYMGKRYFENNLFEEARKFFYKAVKRDYKVLFYSDLALFYLLSYFSKDAIDNIRYLKRSLSLYSRI